MFQYTREVIINGQPFASMFAGEVFRVDHVGDYKKEYITRVTMVEPVDGQCASVAIPTTIPTGTYDVVRYVINLAMQQGEVDAILANYTTLFRRGIVVEVAKGATTAEIKAAFQNAFIGLEEWPVKFDGTNVVAKTPYLDIRLDIETLAYRPNSISEMVVVSRTEGTKVEGVKPFGTYDYLTANLRLPTYENVRWGNELGEDRPVPGVNYTLVEMKLTADRNIGGYSVLGEKATSVTTHRFWVAGSKISTFETELRKVVDASLIYKDEVTPPTAPPTGE